MARSAIDANPFVHFLPVRHAPIVFAAHGSPNVNDRQRCFAATLEQRRGATNQITDRRLQRGRVQEVVLQIQQDQRRSHQTLIPRERLTTASATSDPISRVPARRHPGSSRSRVRHPWRHTWLTARSTRQEASDIPKLSRRSIASAKICPTGFTTFFPARSWAAPWLV